MNKPGNREAEDRLRGWGLSLKDMRLSPIDMELGFTGMISSGLIWVKFRWKKIR